MGWWRATLASGLLLLVGVPLLLPFADLLKHPSSWEVWREQARLLELAANTALLVTGTLFLVLPCGVVAAVLFYRTDLPGRVLLRTLTLLTLFIPLPLFASAWQAALEPLGWFPVPAWTGSPANVFEEIPVGLTGTLWLQGIGAAVWIHAMAGLPWVIWLVGQGLCWVERDLEEAALLDAAPLRVLWHVTLPRSGAALFAAGLWVTLQTANEITVTDMVFLRTFAEEVYVQMVRPDTGTGIEDIGLIQARAVAVTAPQIILTLGLLFWTARRMENRLPPRITELSEPYWYQLGGARWPVLAAVVAVVGLLLGVPLCSLVWRAGLAGNPETWSLATVGEHLTRVIQLQGKMIGQSVALAGIAGSVTAGLALVLCWLALEARWLYFSLLAILALSWALPGPVVGIGLKETIAILLDQVPSQTLAIALYYGPSPLPILWAFLLRLLPFGLALLWPIMRLLPRELRDAVRIDGAYGFQELRHLVGPLYASACVRVGVAVGVLSLGELSASKLVATPGSQTFSQMLFDRMHYGVTNEVAALCLVLLSLVMLGGLVVIGLVRWKVPAIF
ncbi:MAG: ABC transporter permease [Gemmataceae bacterium]